MRTFEHVSERLPPSGRVGVQRRRDELATVLREVRAGRASSVLVEAVIGLDVIDALLCDAGSPVASAAPTIAGSWLTN